MQNFFGVNTLAELMEVRNDAPVKGVSVEEYRMLWRCLSPVLRFGHEEMVTKQGRDVLWCPGERCWWEPRFHQSNDAG